MSTVVRSRAVELRSDAEALWPFLTDTERLNRRAGLGTVEMTPLSSGTTAARYLARTSIAGWPIEYEEMPFEWERPRRWSIERRMRNGPMRVFRMGCTLGPREAAQPGTRVVFSLDIDPRWALMKPVLALVADRVLGQFEGLAREVDESLVASGPYPFQEPRSPCASVGLAAARDGLLREGVAAEQADRLIGFLRELPDFDATRIRPAHVARALEVSQRDAVSLCLRAVIAGLFEIRWALLCPSCLVPSQKLPSLAELGTEGHCQLCDLRYGLALDRAVEAIFVPHPAVRSVPDVVYCIGGPARTPHVVAQAIVPIGQTRPLVVPASPAKLRLFVRGGKATRVEVEEGQLDHGDAVIGVDGVEPAALVVGTSGHIDVRNGSDAELHARLERTDWIDEATTAHDVSMLAEFRDRFSAEILRPGLALGVSRVALVFTDLVGSTALYSRLGEARAFGVVSAHFDLLRAAIEPAAGVVVKTMGDAVMAAFRTPADAVRASVAALESFGRFRETEADARDLGLKVGMHAGPCYVVTANGVLDYFGQVVNTAARIQGHAKAGELVLEESIAAEPDVAAALARLAAPEAFRAHLKGIEGEVPLVRCRLP
ncbi:MAG: hypothetical protein IT379_22335 [Deltaproteobacteria bacterium]|nr:hypothetical protein [Deltaproteobacteria bacterium]